MQIIYFKYVFRVYSAFLPMSPTLLSGWLKYQEGHILPALYELSWAVFYGQFVQL